MLSAGQLAQLDIGPSCHPCPRWKDGETEQNHEFDHVTLFIDFTLSQHEAWWKLLFQQSQAWDMVPSRVQDTLQLSACHPAVHCSDICRGRYTAPVGRHGHGMSPTCPNLTEKGKQGSSNPYSIWKGHGGPQSHLVVT